MASIRGPGDVRSSVPLPPLGEQIRIRVEVDILASLSRLSDAQLVAQVKSLVARERDATAQIVAHLAELDARDVHLREGHTSLFVYCRDVLGLSEWEAYNRIEVV